MTVAQLIRDLNAELAAFEQDYAGLDLRAKVQRLAEVLKNTRSLNVVVVRESGCDASQGRERIRLYLTRYVGVVLDALELEVVSGISEYGRRIRELRVQDGYRILSGASNDPDAGVVLRPDQYLLLCAEPDLEAARRWHIANRIRRETGVGGRERILRYLKENVGQVVTSEELAYVANVREFGRRTRELRTEEGYAVATFFTGRPDLRPGEYVLESADRIAPPHDRHVPEDVQRAVYARDQNTCCNCGWQHPMWTRYDPRFLELHHIEEHAHGGENVTENLLVLCNRCHDDAHAGRINAAALLP
jgi:hypothetical protein